MSSTGTNDSVQAEATDAAPEHIVFRERLWPRWSVALLLLAGPAILGIAYGAATGPWGGWSIFAVALVAVVLTVIATTPIVVVTRASLRAGTGRLPIGMIGTVVELDGSSRRQVLAEHATAYTVLRTWCAASAVQVTVEDPEDPHPFWILTTRRPQVLASAIADVRGARAPDSTGPDSTGPA